MARCARPAFCALDMTPRALSQGLVMQPLNTVLRKKPAMKDVKILQHCSGIFKPGRLTLLVGPPGGVSPQSPTALILFYLAPSAVYESFWAALRYACRTQGLLLSSSQWMPGWCYGCSARWPHLPCPAGGKTMLMKACIGATPKGVAPVEVTGKITYNGHTLDEFNAMRTARYVDQFDLHNPLLTVRETLMFSARVQGPGYNRSARPVSTVLP